MENEQVLTKLIDKILSTCKNEFKILEKFIDDIPEFQLPTYSQLINPEFFLETNTSYTQISVTNHYHKVKISKIMIDLSSIINEISKYKLNSVLQKGMNDLKASKEKCIAYTNTLEEYQKSINQVLQHLQTFSYTVTQKFYE